MLTLLVIFGLIVLIGWGALYQREHSLLYLDSGERTAVVFGGIALSFLLFILVFTRTNNILGNASLELAYSTTIQNYETTVNESRDLLSPVLSNAKFVEGSIEKMQIASTVAQRIVELRDQVNRLNEIITNKNAWANEYLLGGFLWTPPAPKHLKPYVLK